MRLSKLIAIWDLIDCSKTLERRLLATGILARLRKEPMFGTQCPLSITKQYVLQASDMPSNISITWDQSNSAHINDCDLGYHLDFRVARDLLRIL